MAYPRREIVEVEGQLLFRAVERMDVRIGAAKPDIIPQLFDVVLAPVQAQAMEQLRIDPDAPFHPNGLIGQKLPHQRKAFRNGMRLQGGQLDSG